MQSITNPFTACLQACFKPNPVFATLAEKQNWSWIAFFVVTVLSLWPTYLYFSAVDFTWYTEWLIGNTMMDASPAEQEYFAKSLTRENTLFFSTLGGLIVLLVANAILAVYLNLITRRDPDNLHEYTDWYGFTWWISLPIFVSSLLSIVLILLSSDSQLSPVLLVPTSLAFIFDVSVGSDWFNLAQSIRLESLWSMYLIAVGVSRWTKIEPRQCYLIAVLPYLAVWSIWVLMIAL